MSPRLVAMVAAYARLGSIVISGGDGHCWGADCADTMGADALCRRMAPCRTAATRNAKSAEDRDMVTPHLDAPLYLRHLRSREGGEAFDRRDRTVAPAA